jgi:large repetitive protein
MKSTSRPLVSFFNTGFAVPFLLWGIVGDTSMVLAQSLGTFSRTGDLTTARQFHTATLLTNGKVLIAGGFTILTGVPVSGFPVHASAELYDPSTRTFTPTGNMAAARHGHTATLLPNGKVLIAGGHFAVNADGLPPLTGAELYDPSTGTFTATGAMTTGRAWHTATLLNNGRVLIAGGGLNSPLSSAELYDPSTGTFTTTGTMSIARAFYTASLLHNGKVLIAGGRLPDDSTANPELYDPDTGTFILTGVSAFQGVLAQTSSLLTNGKVLVTSEAYCWYGDQAELYDPLTGTFTTTGNMTTLRIGGTATPLPDGKVLIAGGTAGHPEGRAELYDPFTGKFGTSNDALTQSMDGHGATLLPDGTVLLSGGWICCGVSLSLAETYRPALLVPSPVLFSLSGDGRGAGAILHAQTHQIVSPDNPAVAGEALELYLTGLTDGSLIPPQVAIGGRMAQVLFFGKAPGFANLNQVNVRVPSGIVAGPAVGVRLTYLARPSNEVTISVR